MTILLPIDDAATAIWGDDWRAPTIYDCVELLENTTATWTTRNGVNGRLFIASNGNSLFLPAAGLRLGSSLINDGSIGYYTTSSLNTNRPCQASRLGFDSNSCFTGTMDRNGGKSVRAVHSGQPSITTYTITVSANTAEGGNVSGGGTFQSGETCTVVATANSGYTFTNWTENGSVVTTDDYYSFNVDANRTLVANFTYNGGGGGAPTGAINGLFTINSNGDQVYFSKGNLQFIGSATTPHWKFADHQWDYLGTTTNQNSNYPNVDRDLFGWGTSGYSHGAAAFRPWDTSNSLNYFAYGNSTYNLYQQDGRADWGYNAISNGGNQENSGWRTLTYAEWRYVFDIRPNAGSKWGHGSVNGVNGMVLLPDEWTLPNGVNYFFSGSSEWINAFTTAQWAQMEANGAIFLPAAGYRDVVAIYGSSLNVGGNYWSSSNTGNYQYAYFVHFGPNAFDSQDAQKRFVGFSVRLVRNAE